MTTQDVVRDPRLQTLLDLFDIFYFSENITDHCLGFSCEGCRCNIKLSAQPKSFASARKVTMSMLHNIGVEPERLEVHLRKGPLIKWLFSGCGSKKAFLDAVETVLKENDAAKEGQIVELLGDDIPEHLRDPNWHPPGYPFK